MGMQKTCLLCGKIAVARGRGWAHYQRWHRHESPHIVLKTIQKALVCKTCGATRDPQSPTAHCTECRKNYIHKQNIRWNETHKEERRKLWRDWYEKNKIRRTLYLKNYYHRRKNAVTVG